MKIAKYGLDKTVLVTFDNGDTYAVNQDGTSSSSEFPVGSLSSDEVIYDDTPEKPAHPLRDALVGEWWALTWSKDDFVEVVQITQSVLDSCEKWEVVSARRVYVLPKAEADETRNLSFLTTNERTVATRVLDGALK